MGTYRELLSADTTTRQAAGLTGVSRAAAARAQHRPGTPQTLVAPATVPANVLTQAEREEVLAVLDSAEFVDGTPVQAYATLLDQGTYLCSVSTMYRVLADHAQIKERRRLARHPARARPELVATCPGQVYTSYAEVVVMPTSVRRCWPVVVAGA